MSALIPADLKVIFDKAPAQAIEYLRRKAFSPSTHWFEVSAQAHARAFTVAKAVQLDVLAEIRRALILNMEQGGTLRDFQKQLKPLLEKKGWWGKTEEGVQLGSPRRLRTIYQTNLQSAFMAARYAGALEASHSHPYWMYVAVMDGLTRPEHAQMHGRVFRYDDPIWQHMTPPNGFNCRCQFVAISDETLKRRGLTVESSAGKLKEIDLTMGVDQQTGEVFRQKTTVYQGIGRNGQPFTFHADAGFDASPLASHLLDQLLYDKALRALGTAGEAVALDYVQSTLLDPIRQKGWEAFVAGARRRGKSYGHTMAFGVLGLSEMNHLRKTGAPVKNGVVFLHDRNLAGLKGRRHQSVHQNALTADEYKTLPQRFSQKAGKTILWDNKDGILLYLIPANDGSGDFFKMTVRLSRHEKAYGPLTVDDVGTVFRITQGAAAALLGESRYQSIP